MMVRVLFNLFLFFCVFGVAAADDLYEVKFTSNGDISYLIESGAQSVHQGHNMALVLMSSDQADALIGLGMDVSLLATDVDVSRLAVDARRDDYNSERFEAVYEEGGYRLFVLSAEKSAQYYLENGLMPILPGQAVMRYQPQAVEVDPTLQPLVADLDSMIALISVDSLWSYLNHLQSYDPRVAGSLANSQARDWLRDKFVEFGYDSVLLDHFQANIGGTIEDNYNVLAYKIGSKFPDHHVIVGAHMDAVPGSPGADDNGSGTVGVLEIARVLKDIDTDMTIVFALFDAEEWGLYGSWYYAQSAYDRGDEIVYMLNMDMIGYIANTTRLNLFYGSDATYSVRLGELADSLLGMTAVFAGTSAGSDHYPFTQLGYPATFVAEYIFSTVYHSYQDSTTYIDPNYMTKLVQVSLANSYWVSQTQGPLPTLAFDYPGGIPISAPPETNTAFVVDVSELYDGVAVAASGLVHYSVDGAPYNSVAMTPLSADQYEVSLPGGECFSQIDFYVSVEEQSMGLMYDPDPSEPNVLIVADSQVVIINDDAETDLGWTTDAEEGVIRGKWQRGVPVNDASWSYDPVSDGDGSGQCYLTQNILGNTDVDDGWVRLTSPVMDFTNGGDISFYYYLQLTNDNGVDKLLIEADDGSGWTTIGSITASGGLLWHEYTISESTILAAGITQTNSMQVRFTVNDGDPQSIVEAGIDGFRLDYFACLIGCCGKFNAGFTGNIDCGVDGRANLADITRLIDRVYVTKLELCCEENGNVDGDLEAKINLADITRLIDHVYVSKEDTELCQ